MDLHYIDYQDSYFSVKFISIFFIIKLILFHLRMFIQYLSIRNKLFINFLIVIY